MFVFAMLADPGQTRAVSAVLQRVDAQGATLWQPSSQSFVAAANWHTETDAVAGIRVTGVPGAADFVSFVVPGPNAPTPGVFYVLIPTTAGLSPVGVAPYEYPPQGFAVVG